jgi:hypothetical protein
MYEYRDQILKVAERVPTTVPEVIQQQLDLQEVLRANAKPAGGVCGLAYFNYLYRIITEAVLQDLREDRFTKPEFLERLDVEFARRYFQALAAWSRDPAWAPRSWAILLDQADNQKITALQFAVAGVNAHVNFDLALSLIAAFRHLGMEFDEGCRDDYDHINEIFRLKIRGLRDDLQNTFWDTVDRLLGEVDDWLDDMIVIATRGIAWRTAHRIWPHRHDPAEMVKETRRLDFVASMLGRGMLMRMPGTPARDVVALAYDRPATPAGGGPNIPAQAASVGEPDGQAATPAPPRPSAVGEGTGGSEVEADRIAEGP